MGADLIASWGFIRKGTKLNLNAALAVVDTLSDNELDDYLGQTSGDYLRDDRDRLELKEEIKSVVRDLVNDVDVGTRGLISFPTPGNYTCIFAGGSSWGDDPCEEFTEMSNLWALPRVMGALGFFTEEA